MRSFDDALSALTPEQRAAFELLLRRQRTAAPGTGEIPRRADPSAHPLSFAQQRLWFLDQLAPGDPAYNIHGAVRLRGAVDPGSLAQALSALVTRHEPLRARFAAVEGEPVQTLAPAGPVPLPAVDLGVLPAAVREPEILRCAVEESRRPFDLTQGPLLRASLLRGSPTDHVLLVTIHHIAADGWSIGVLLRELAAAYAACAAGRPADLPPLPISYSDFAAWQRERLRGERLAREVEHWRAVLAGLPELRFPSERPLPDGGTRGSPGRSSGGAVPVTLPAALVERLREIGREAGASLFMILLAVFQVLLSRWTGQRDFAVGAPVAHRTRPELEGLIGFFVNTLVLRADLRGDPSFRELLERVERTAVDAFSHQELPFEKLVEELQPRRQPGSVPFVAAVLALENLPAAPARLPGVELELLPVRNGTARFDLTLTLAEAGEGLAGDLDYRLSVLSPAAARRMAGHLRVLLEAVAADPGVRVSTLPLLTAAERRQILEVWSLPGTRTDRTDRTDLTDDPTDRSDPSDRSESLTLPRLFAAQAARTPDAVALIDGERAVTYGELDRRSARLARRLRAAGAGPDAPVAVLLERSAEMVVALVGIVRAGAAYVPLDLGYPRDRLAWMLADSGARVVVTRGEPPDRIVEGQTMVRVDDLAADAPDVPAALDAPDVPVSPDRLAYILYTSGSTGRPKGVAVPHRAVARLVIAPGYVELGPDETILQLAPVPFDASTFEIWGALLNGGRLAVFPAGPVSLRELAAALHRYRVTTVFLTAGLFHQMIDEEPDGLAGLRQLIAGGDVVSAAHARRALERLPGCRLVNGYGPTETTTFALCHPIAPEDTDRPVLPLGRPIPRTGVWLLDESLAPVPEGVPGELCVSGDGLARGYWRQPAQTAERFVPHPFAAASGERLYRTGDLARWRPDGTVDFLGRTDRQVKIRGFRIEPAEIETALEMHPALAAAVVQPRDDGRGGKRLVAWIVPAVEPPSDAGLLAWCRDRLPAFMVPAAFVRMDTLPLDPNGKVDRAALPGPDWRGDPRAAPRTPEEERIAAVWAEVLAVGQVGVDDDFFALGGHSLLAARMISRIRGELGVELPLQTLFENPTVRGLAAVIGRHEPRRPAALPPPLPRQRGAEAPLSFAQRRLWLLHQVDPGLTAYHVSAAVRLRGRLDPTALERALDEIVRRHEALRTAFPIRSGEPVQLIESPSAGAHLARADLSALPEDRREAAVRRIAEAAARQPFDLEHGPLLRPVLLRSGPDEYVRADEHVLVLVVHHLVFDGWSTAIFLRELSALYAAFLDGLPSPLPEPRLQYADWALWQRDWLRGEVLDEQLWWWRDRLESAPRVLDLPTDLPHPPVESRAGAAVPVRLPAALAARVRALGHAADTAGAGDGPATLFMVLLAAFQALLSRLSGQETVSVGTHVAGRDRLESEDLIGFFVNTLVIRADLEGNPSGRELIGRVRDAVLGAFAHQDLPFEQLVEALGPARDLGRPPLFQVSFTLQNMPREDLRLPGLETEGLAVSPGMVQYDLSLALSEDGEALTGALWYRTSLFLEPTVRRLVRSYETFLEGLVAEPGTPVAVLPLLTAAERQEILVEWTGPERADLLSPEQGLVERFARQASRAPRAVAAVCGGESITYAELDRRSNQLARWLRRRGAGPETVVAISVERSLEMVVGLLGILKSGAAYLPLDPLNPRERQGFLLEDSGASILLTQERWASGLTPEILLCLDTGWAEPDREADGPLPPCAGPGNAIALLYTSGTTGRPKATVVPALGFLHLCLWFAEACPLTPRTRSLLALSFSFDASFKVLLGPLLAGGQVVLPPPGPYDAGEMLAAIRRHEVNLICTTPGQIVPILQRAAAEGWDGMEKVETLILGGEAAHWAELGPWLESGSCRAAVLHMYGPSEAADTVACHRVPPEDIEEIAAAERLPVGRPIPDTRLMVMDAGLQPLPIGVPGELCVAGAGLARGYHARPGLTAERFVPDPWGRGDRMYRTGDFARFRADGTLEILGRIDHQLKIRGIRVEASEVEAALLAHPAVRDAVVGARQSPAREKRLIAWIVPVDGGAPPTAAALREVLRRRLPDVMIPAAFVPLAELPLTPRGKIDRRALPDPERAGAPSELTGLPADPIEEKLLHLFDEVLGIEGTALSDSLFDLGGHSLSAFRLATRIREVFGVRLAVRRLFTAPSPAGLAAVIRASGRDDSGLPPIRRVPRNLPDRPLPLSLAQQRLWVLHQLMPGLTTYHIPACLRLRGVLDLAALAHALTEILRRHEALRTHFPLRHGKPVQEIDPPAPAALPLLDLSAVPAAEREAEVRRIAVAESLRPFDLERGPLLRLALLRLDLEDHALLLVAHHLVSDGWSAALFLRELSTLYGAFTHGESSPLPEPPVQYADWAVWQREQLQGEVLEAHLRWWTERLAGAPRVLDLPTDRPRPPVEDPAGASVPFSLPKPLVEALRGLARAAGATLYMALLAGFQALLARIAGQETVCVGTHVARRNHLEVEGLIGFFINTVVIRTDVTGAHTGRELVGQVREAVFGAFAHQDLPFEHLVEALDLERDPRWSPLFQVSFALQNVPREEPGLPGLDVERLETGDGGAHFDLAATISETAAGADGALSYRTALFFASTVRRLAGHYRAFLEALAERPDAPLSALSFLTAAERHQILIEWAGPERALPDAGLPELFAAQAARAPGATAVVCGAASCTYRDLDRRSNQLARWLRRHGAGPEAVVAISVERSVEMVVGLLGILKSGAACLPIDPLNPRERQAFLLEDAGASILLTQERWTADLTPGFSRRSSRVLRLDADGEEIAREEEGPLRPAAGPEHLQALFYTSGSTGRPKATALTARGLLNLCLWFRDVCPILPDTRSLLGFSFGFDAAFKNVLVPLLVGGTTVLPPPGPFDAGEVLEAIRREAVTFLNTTPSQMSRILDHATKDGWTGLETLRTLILGGEAAHWEELLPWLASGRCRAEILHMYGPSEASDTVSCHRATPDEIAGIAAAGRLPVGRAADNMRLIVVDAGLQPLPIGVPGELCLGGIGVARGYLGRPALTAEKFVPDPFRPGERMYRTGDLARWLSDGSVEILGRIDHQVKIRGIRVEPAEVEAALTAHPAVAAAVVAAREGEAGDKRLIAWLVPAGDGGLPPPGALREHLRASLPEVMIPAAFVPLAALPVTPRGKIDRSALPDPAAARAEAASVPPRDAIELRCAALFQEVLGGGEIGVRDSFFDLGGHSLAAVRLAGRIRESLGIELPVAALFQAPTVEALVRLLRQRGEIDASPLVPLRAVGDREPLFLVHPGGGGVFAYLDLVRRLPPGRPVFGLQAPGLDPGQEPLRDVGEMADLYLAEIRRMQPRGPWHLAGWSFGGLVAFEMARRLRTEGEEIAGLALIDPTDPSDLTDHPTDPSDRSDPSDANHLTLLAAFARELGLPPETFGLTAEEALHLSPEARWSLLLDKGREAGRLRPGDDIADLRRRFEVFRASAEAAAAFRPGPYDGPLDLFEAAERPAPAAAWRRMARRVVILPGDHYSLLVPPRVEALAKELGEL